jgi:polyhydroxyalkanoate synthesis repressor PhaR
LCTAQKFKVFSVLLYPQRCNDFATIAIRIITGYIARQHNSEYRKEDSMEGPRIYKKYANRRIYDTLSSSYITLEELAEVIRKGQEVKVVDAKSKEDVTPYILTQIVLEQAKRNNALLPVPILHLVIQYGDNVLLEFFNTYLQQIAHNYIRYKKYRRCPVQAVAGAWHGFLRHGAGRHSGNPLFCIVLQRSHQTRKGPRGLTATGSSYRAGSCPGRNHSKRW